MPGLGYLSNAPDDLQPEESEEEQRLRLLNAGPPGGRTAWWKPPTSLPAPAPLLDEPPTPLRSVSAGNSIPDVASDPNRQTEQPMPDVSGVLEQSRSDVRVPGIAPVDANVRDASARLQQVFGNKPKPKEPKWWQRAIAGAAGFGAGYLNAEGKTGHTDPSGAVDVALGGPGNRRRETNWQNEVQQAQLGLQGAQGERDAWFKRNKEEADQRLQQAQSEHLGAQTEQAKAGAEATRAGTKDRYLKVGDGVFDKKLGKWAQPPVNKNETIEISPDWAKKNLPMLVPDEDGAYRVPVKGLDSILTNTTKPLKPDQINAVQLAIRAAGGDPSKPESITPEIAKRASEILKPQMPGIQLTPEAVQFWGQAAAQGVPLPSMGMGPAGASARQQIINAAPGLAGNGTLAGNRAVQRADTTSLGAMTKMRDAVVAFESTANANLGMFEQAAKKVIDSGSPWVNQPLRTINRAGLGSADQAAFDAARQVALTEISKVVNNPNLTGQLSDSARKEVTSLLPESATLAQIYRVSSILRQDMANRRKYLDEGVQGIQGRMGGGSQAGAPAQQPDAMITVRLKDGRTGPIHASQLQNFLRDNPGAQQVQ